MKHYDFIADGIRVAALEFGQVVENLERAVGKRDDMIALFFLVRSRSAHLHNPL